MMTGSMYTSLRGVPTVSVVREWLALFRWRWIQSRKPVDFSGLFSTIADYRDRLKRLSDVDLERAKVLEIGFGQRPYLLCTLRSMGVDRKSTRLNSSHMSISYAVFCLKK